ncbi:MAG: hypothetical protein HY718_13690 [Planctomycetes bacterium]|nr:hypothetical protein [Planctomycetota bacterium]
MSKGVDPISPADITWCDDFDSYCDNNCGDACDPAWPAHSVWPGYPPSPDNLCDHGGLDPSGGPNDPSAEYFLQSYHWPLPTISNPAGMSNSAPGAWLTDVNPGGARWAGWDDNPGWTTTPYALRYKGFSNTNQYHTFSLEAAAGQRFPGSDALNGTDANPLTLRFWMNPAEGMNPVGVIDSPPILALYVELRMDNDHAPTDYVEKDCAPEVGMFPVVCQQRHHPAACPALSTATHASLAFGWLAPLDNNPCDVETGRKPTTYHAAVFDGLKWTQLFASMFAGQVGKFNWDSGQAYFEVKVKTSVVEIKQIAYVQDSVCLDPPYCDDMVLAYVLKTSTATVPRQYLGAFNRISIGAAPGCKLDQDGNCLGEPDVWRYAQDNSSLGWHHAYVDRPALLGGVGASSLGACCKADGSCSVETASACAAGAGVWRGINTTCDGSVCTGACCQAAGVCTQTLVNACPGNYRGIGTNCATPGICPCPTPFADYDMDGDVDMDDFAGFQRCLTITGGAILQGCECFDQDTSGTIDNTDIEKFALCATGKDVAWSPTVDCP